MFPDPKGPQVNLHQEDFDNLVEKGVRVKVEKALQCPCKTFSTTALSTCQNCGGTGYIFVNPRETVMVLKSMTAKIDIEQFTYLTKGMVSVSHRANEELAYMDKITRVDSRAIYNQVIQFLKKDDFWFAPTVYVPLSMEFIGVYVGEEQKLQKLEANQYAIENNFIKLYDNVQLPFDPSEKPLTATIRYKHAPTFHIVDFNREYMDNWKVDTSGHTLQQMPISCSAQKAEYILNQKDINGLGMINNDYEEDCNCCEKGC